jgi:CBS domain containing-hemolysin-like protein
LSLLLLYVGFALGVSFLCSLLEAGLFSARIATLTEKRDAGSRGAALLLAIKQKNIDDAISAILTLNTIANTLGATLAGAQAAHVFGSAWIGVFSGVLTLLILVVSEIIPKTLGAVYSARLSGFVGWSLHLMTRSMAPVLFASRVITRLLTRGRSSGFSRGELAAVISAATRDGAISTDESKLLSNLLRFREVRVADVMTPRMVVFMLPAESTIAEMLTEPDADVFSRIPLYREERDNVVGYVLQRDVLSAVARDCDRSQTLERFVRPISFIPELATVDSALNQILRRREPIAMVTDEHGGVEGLVTLEDLTETILGVEIVDESDRIVDMRKAALRLRDARLERMQQKRAFLVDEGEDGE